MPWGGVSPPWKYEQLGEDANEERPHANYVTDVANGAAKPVAPPMMPVVLSEMACYRELGHATSFKPLYPKRPKALVGLE